MKNSAYGEEDAQHDCSRSPVVQFAPKDGRLIPLKTRGEARASHELIDGYVVALPAKEVSALIKYDCPEKRSPRCSSNQFVVR